jgi:hypothetical protein
MIIGNGAGTTTGTAAFGTYNLSGGTLTGAAATTRGIILGTNNGTTGTFNLTDTGATDSVKISIPKTAATNGKLFGLLKVVR